MKTLNERIVAMTGTSPGNLMVMFQETAGENISFGQDLAQRAQVSGRGTEAARPQMAVTTVSSCTVEPARALIRSVRDS